MHNELGISSLKSELGSVDGGVNVRLLDPSFEDPYREYRRKSRRSYIIRRFWVVVSFWGERGEASSVFFSGVDLHSHPLRGDSQLLFQLDIVVCHVLLRCRWVRVIILSSSEMKFPICL